MNCILRAWRVNFDSMDDHMHRLIFSPGLLAQTQTRLTWWRARFLSALKYLECFKCSCKHRDTEKYTQTHTVRIVEYSLVSIRVQRQWVIFKLHMHAHKHTLIQIRRQALAFFIMLWCPCVNEVITQYRSMIMVYGSFETLITNVSSQISSQTSYTHSHTLIRIHTLATKGQRVDRLKLKSSMLCSDWQNEKKGKPQLQLIILHQPQLHHLP